MAITNVMSRSLMSASSSIKMARIQNNVKKQMDGRAGVLKAEIKQEGGKDKAPEKQKELEETEKNATKVNETTMNTLSGLNDDLKEAAKADQEEMRAQKAAEKKKEEKAAAKKKEEKKAQEERQEKTAEAKVSVDSEGSEESGASSVRDISTAIPSPEHVTINVASEGITPNVHVAEPVGAKVDVKA